MGFVLRARGACSSACAGNSTSLALDLHDQWTYMEKTTQWRYTPPTHVVVALRRRARPVRRPRAASRRASRATRRTARRWSPGMAELGFRAVPRAARSRRRSSSPSMRRPIRRTRFKALLRARPRQGLHPLSGQAHAGRDVPRRLHRRDRSRRDAARGQRRARHAGARWASGRSAPAPSRAAPDGRIDRPARQPARRRRRRAPGAAARPAQELGRVRRDRAVPQQAVEHDEARVGGDDGRARRRCAISRAAAPRSTSRCSTTSPSWSAGHEVRRAATRSCTKIVSRWRPSGWRATDVHGACRHRAARPARRRCRLPPTASLTTVAATVCPAAMPPPTRLSSMPGVDRLRRRCGGRTTSSAASGGADEPVDVRGVRADAEVARRRALEQEPRGGAEAGAPRRSARRATRSARLRRRACARPRRAPRCARAASRSRRHERESVAAAREDAIECRQACGARRRRASPATRPSTRSGSNGGRGRAQRRGRVAARIAVSNAA